MGIKHVFISSRSVCLLLLIAVLAGMLFGFKPLRLLEYTAYDLMSTLRRSKEGIPVIVVRIDDLSLNKVGDWPWPRSYIAQIVNTLSKSGAHTLGISILYCNRELNAGKEEIQNLREKLPENLPPVKKQTLKKIDRLLAQTQNRLNHDARLISAVRKARNVVLPLRFILSESDHSTAPVLSDWLKMNSLRFPEENAARNLPVKAAAVLFNRRPADAIRGSQVLQPYQELSRKSGALGHINLIADPDGKIRSVPLFIRFQDRDFVSLALEVAMKYDGATIRNIRKHPTGLQIKQLSVPTIGPHQMLLDFSGRETNIQRISAVDLMEGKIDPERFRNKAVLFGLSADAAIPRYHLPRQGEASNLEITACAVENIINRRHISRPSWFAALEILVLLYFGFFLLVVVPKVPPRTGLLIFAVFLTAWLGVAVLLLVTQGQWLRSITPTLFAAVGFIIIGRQRISDAKKDESVELNKSLGLSLQGQGMLDMAFERFLKCPITDKSVKALLYNLGLDFERKRMLNKALAVYNHILKAGTFKDIKRRIKQLEQFEQTLAIPVGQNKKNAGLLWTDSTTKPTLGRYEIIKELGRGAMGTVYLGKDPSINREVAIKTLDYADVDAQQLNEVKDQFFREAEAAGKLSHPNIVTIYDVGEDHDMAYIAMELLKGRELTHFCKKDNLLPVDQVLRIGLSVAEALAYAHQQGVVHRDIKPANIIVLENDQIKVADFGIARVMSSSTKTETGIIFGTPNYMSPEQVAGKKVDGRSDLFSLGVVLYEMLSAEKPFTGENITALMYAIAHSNYAPLSQLSPQTPKCCVKLIDKLLRKGVSKRYQRADQLIKQIHLCRQH
ncbi:MAG: serine/threonine-protein kinase [Desulfobacterales bacterium]|jgi:serine/threonine-protein kinase